MWRVFFGITLALLVLFLPTAIAQSTHHHPDQDFPYENLKTDALNLAENNNELNPQGLWTDKTTLWVADQNDDKLYAYNLATRQRDPDKDFTLATDNENPYGICSDNTTMWVLDWQDLKLYAYKMAGANHGDRNAAKEFALAAANTNPTCIWSDGEGRPYGWPEAERYMHSIGRGRALLAIPHPPRILL